MSLPAGLAGASSWPVGCRRASLEFDLPFVMATNLTPYGIVGALVLLRRAGHMRRRASVALAIVALYILVIALAPVGGVARAINGWAGYAIIFVGLGSATWASFLFWWLAWLIWSGRLTSQQRSETKNPAFFLYRRSAPAFAVTGAVLSGLLPWIWPLTQLPGGLAWLIAAAALVGALLTLATAVNVSSRAPRFLLPRDLATQSQPAGDPFWVDVVFVIVTAALAAAPVVVIQNSTHWSGWTLGVVSLPVVWVSGVLAFGISRLVKRLVQP